MIILGVVIWVSLNKNYDKDTKGKVLKLFNPKKSNPSKPINIFIIIFCFMVNYFKSWLFGKKTINNFDSKIDTSLHYLFSQLKTNRLL